MDASVRLAPLQPHAKEDRSLARPRKRVKAGDLAGAASPAFLLALLVLPALRLALPVCTCPGELRKKEGKERRNSLQCVRWGHLEIPVLFTIVKFR